MSEVPYHIPVLLKETIDLLEIKGEGVYVDVTFGGGGHSREILLKLTSGKLIAFDRDRDAKKNIPESEQLTFIAEDFKFIETLLTAHGYPQVDGILADLGVSSHQFDTPERGFSFRYDAPLDMRMNTGQPQSAADLVNQAEEEELVEIFQVFGEIQNARKLVRLIKEHREQAPIETTFQLEEVIQSCIPHKKRSKYLAQVFQALRIAVNQEMESLTQFLVASSRLIKPGGRLVVISYHSLEDRLVKRFMRSGNLNGTLEKDFYGNPITPWKLITRRAIQPPETEIDSNSRARSARLRAAERK